MMYTESLLSMETLTFYEETEIDCYSDSQNSKEKVKFVLEVHSVDFALETEFIDLQNERSTLSPNMLRLLTTA